jgi:hypothetical protein
MLFAMRVKPAPKIAATVTDATILFACGINVLTWYAEDEGLHTALQMWSQ